MDRSREDLDEDLAQQQALQAELSQAQNAEVAAQETLKSGGDRLKAARDELKRAEALEREARIALESESHGLNPDVRQTMAELDRKRWELEQTTVTAPSEGYVTHVSLRPGQMATPFSVASAMLFVPRERRILVATFPQTAIAGFEPGLEAELAFTALPGRIYKATVARVLGIVPEGQFMSSGQLQSTTAAGAAGDVPVAFEYGEDVEALDLPIGAQASIAVYTHKFHALSLVRKIILRVKSWENYAFFMKHLDAVH
jgi:multidrug resistance efflux pump